MLYPQYFDSKISRKMGRRISKDLAVNSPNLAKIEEACKRLGFKVIIEPNKAYPRMSNSKCGRIVIFCNGIRKGNLIKKISRIMKGGVG